MGDQLIEFLRSKKEQAATPEIDWQAKKDDWILVIANLYTLVETILRESIENNDVGVRKIPGEVTEPFIGTYTIPTLELMVGGERVEFRPKGLTVIGAAGRVDIRGERDTVTLVRNTNEGASEWSIVLQRVPRLKTVELNPDSLKDVLERVMLPLP